MRPFPFFFLQSHSNPLNCDSSRYNNDYSDGESPQFGLEVHEICLININVLQCLAAKLLSDLQSSIWPLIDILSYLLVISFVLMLFKVDLMSLDHIVYPICNINDVISVCRVFADVQKLRIRFQLSKPIIVLIRQQLEIDISHASDEVFSIFMQKS